MKAHSSTYPVDQVAKVLGVSRSGYYAYLRRMPSQRAQTNETLLARIKTIFGASGRVYGSPRVHAVLKEEGTEVSRPRVARLMQKAGLQAKMYKKFVKTTKRGKSITEACKDLVQQNFTVPSPNRVWVADITYVRVGHKWVYLAVVLDLYARKIVGMALDKRMKASLVLKAFKAATIHRKPPKDLIHHSDLGSQYTGHDPKRLAKKYKVKLSFGQCAYDNAVMESFFHTLKTECIYFARYKTLEEARMSIFTYIHTFYNTKRRHSTLKYLSPNTVEENYERNQ